MIIEYLLKNDSMLKEIRRVVAEHNATLRNSYNYVEIKSQKYSNKHVWVEISRGTDGKGVAKTLLLLDDKICGICNDEKQKLIIVTKDEASQWLNKVLYPLVNQFERNLRRYLFLRSSFAGNKEIIKRVESVDKLTFEQIYRLLFYDEKLNLELTSMLKRCSHKAEFIDFLNNYDEKTIWDTIGDNQELDPVRDSFLAAKEYRNDVMHAHRMGYDRFEKAEELYNDLNSRLEVAIDSLIPADGKRLQYKAMKNGAEAIIAALDALPIPSAENLTGVTDAMIQVLAYMKQCVPSGAEEITDSNEVE